MNIIDLSHTLSTGTPVYPGDTGVVLTLEKKGSYTIGSLKASLHAGTHIDMPMHLTDCGKTADLYDISCFVGEGVFLDCFGKKTIEYEPRYGEMLKENSVAVLYTGFSEYFNQPPVYYGEHPSITEEFAAALVKSKVKAVALDTPSPDLPPFRSHKLLLENNIFIIENLTNLSKLKQVQEQDKHFTIHYAPLNIKAEASLIRAYAVVYD